MCVKKGVSFTALLIVMLVFSSCTAFTLNSVSPFVLGAPDKIVSDEASLRNAINTAVGPIIIALDNDIILTSDLTISYATITLTSNKASGYYKLMGTIVNSGMLTIDSIIITHANESRGSGVLNDGTLIMRSGEISGNFVGIGGSGAFAAIEHSYGGGVQNAGVFEMYGGKISGNTAKAIGAGGGVFNGGGAVFRMYGGEISGNTAVKGGGVCNGGIFTMYGGTISNNTATNGGGVNNWNNFTLTGGSITYNTAEYGGGIYNDEDTYFNKQGGTISNNIATNGDNNINDTYYNIYEESSSDSVPLVTVMLSGLMLVVFIGVIAIVVIVSIIIVAIIHLSKERR